MPDVSLDGPSIRAYLAELADTLPVPSDRHVIVVVGGSLLAMRGLRDTTLDIDSVSHLDAASRRLRGR